jgi:hypothetical protein
LDAAAWAQVIGAKLLHWTSGGEVPFTWPLGSMTPATLPCLVGPSACFHWAGPLAPGPVELNVMSSPVVRLMVT